MALLWTAPAWATEGMTNLYARLAALPWNHQRHIEAVPSSMFLHAGGARKSRLVSSRPYAAHPDALSLLRVPIGSGLAPAAATPERERAPMTAAALDMASAAAVHQGRHGGRHAHRAHGSAGPSFDHMPSTASPGTGGAARDAADDDLADGLLGPTLPIPVVASAAPEPAAWALMVLGFGGLGARLRGRRAA